MMSRPKFHQLANQNARCWRSIRSDLCEVTFSDALNNILPLVGARSQQPRHSSFHTKISSARQILHPTTAPKQRVCAWEFNFVMHSVSLHIHLLPGLEVNRSSVHFSTHKMFLIIAAAAVGGHNNPAVSSPWLSAAARPAANSMGPRRTSRKRGTPQHGASISNPSDLEAGEEGTQRFRQQASDC